MFDYSYGYFIISKNAAKFFLFPQMDFFKEINIEDDLKEGVIYV